MADKEKEDKKADALYSEDVTELVDIYVQMDEMFTKKAKPSIMPNSEDIEKLATTVFIKRQKATTGTWKPEAAETAPKSSGGKTRECPQCNAVLSPKTSKAGKKYYACDDCKGFVNNDGSFTAFRQQ